MSALLSLAQRQIACQARLFMTLPLELRAPLLDSARVSHYARGETIFHRGDTANAIHIVTEGWIKLFRVAPNGAEAIVGIMTRGQSFGEPVALRRIAYPVSAVASTDCQLIAIPSSAILALLNSRPETVASILASTFMHLQELVEHIEQLKARSGTQRVAEFLLELCPEGAESTTVVLPYDKGLIAGRLGLRPESLSRAFSRLRKHGVTIQNATAAIASVGALRTLLAAAPADAWPRVGQALIAGRQPTAPPSTNRAGQASQPASPAPATGAGSR